LVELSVLSDLTEGDISQLYALVESFCDLSSHDVTPCRVATESALWHYVLSAQSDIVVGYRDDKIVGAGVVSCADEFHKERFGYISKFFVLPEYRQPRLIVLLMQRCMEWFDDRDCYKVFSSVTGAKESDGGYFRLLESFGFELSGDILEYG